MTHEDIYKKFMIEYDKANITSSYPSLTKYEVATILDKSYLALIARKFTGNNTRNAGFESDLKAIEDLRPLIVTKRIQLNDRILPQAKNDRRYSLPKDLLYYVKSDIATKDNTRIPTLIVTHNMIDRFKLTLINYPWIDTPVAFILSSDIHVLIDPESDNSVRNGELDVTYIKKPVSFVNSMVNGDEPDEPITPDEPNETTSFEITSENPYVITVPADQSGWKVPFQGVLTTYRDGVEVSTQHCETFEEVALTPNTDVNSYITRGEKVWNGQVCKWEITQLGAEKLQSSTVYYSVQTAQPFRNCNITGTGNYAEGKNVAITVTADSGYKVKKVVYLIGNTEYIYPTDESTRPEQSVSLTFTLTNNTLITDVELAQIGGNNPVPTPPVVDPDTPDVNVEYVDLGITDAEGNSICWATCNLGASSPTEAGLFYAWGETVSKSSYNWSTYKYSGDDQNTLTKYCNNSKYGTVDDKVSLDKSDDVAYTTLGGNWRMPTNDEYTSLLHKCTWKYKTNYNKSGVDGYLVTSNATGNSIFIPMVGFKRDELIVNTAAGAYWSSNMCQYDLNYRAYCLLIEPGPYGRNKVDRADGAQIRPVYVLKAS